MSTRPHPSGNAFPSRMFPSYARGTSPVRRRLQWADAARGAKAAATTHQARAARDSTGARKRARVRRVALTLREALASGIGHRSGVATPSTRVFWPTGVGARRIATPTAHRVAGAVTVAAGVHGAAVDRRDAILRRAGVFRAIARRIHRGTGSISGIRLDCRPVPLPRRVAPAVRGSGGERGPAREAQSKRKKRGEKVRTLHCHSLARKGRILLGLPNEWEQAKAHLLLVVGIPL